MPASTTRLIPTTGGCIHVVIGPDPRRPEPADDSTSCACDCGTPGCKCELGYDEDGATVCDCP